MQKIFIIILLSFCSLYSNAQIELQESDSTEIEIKENVVIYKDSRLDVLDKLPSLIAKLDAEPKEKKNVPLQTHRFQRWEKNSDRINIHQ